MRRAALALALPALLTACGAVVTPEPGTPTDDQVAVPIEIGQVAPGAPDAAEAPEAAPPETAEAESSPATGGLFAFLRAPAPPDAAGPEPDPQPEPEPEAEAEAEPATASDAESPARPGFFAFLRAPAPAPPEDTPAAVPEAPASEAASEPAAAPVAQTAAVAPRGGLFGVLFGGGGAPAETPGDDPATNPDAPLGFGEVVRVCGLGQRELGTAVDRVNGWRLYDTIPNATAPRPMHVTGFDDGCARRFNAALVLFGSASAHETVRYTTRSAYSSTDDAYETIKARVCGVRKGKPCPADRIDTMERQATFVTAYPSFGGSSGPWLEILLFNGDLLASAVTRR